MSKLAETVLAGSLGVVTALGGVSQAQTPPAVKNNRSGTRRIC